MAEAPNDGGTLADDRTLRERLEATQSKQRAAEVALGTLEARVVEDRLELEALRIKAADTARVESELAEAKFRLAQVSSGRPGRTWSRDELKTVLGLSIVSAALMVWLAAAGLRPEASESSGCDGGLCAFELLFRPVLWVAQGIGVLISACAGALAVGLLGVSVWAAHLLSRFSKTGKQG
jgi:hypothetical protein